MAKLAVGSHVTGEEVMEAMVRKELFRADHHACGICGVMVRYTRVKEQLYFNSSCDCSGGGWPQPREWEDAADWINMQTAPENRADLMRRFGIDPENRAAPSPELTPDMAGPAPDGHRLCHACGGRPIIGILSKKDLRVTCEHAFETCGSGVASGPFRTAEEALANWDKRHDPPRELVARLLENLNLRGGVARPCCGNARGGHSLNCPLIALEKLVGRE